MLRDIEGWLEHLLDEMKSMDPQKVEQAEKRKNAERRTMIRQAKKEEQKRMVDTTKTTPTNYNTLTTHASGATPHATSYALILTCLLLSLRCVCIVCRAVGEEYGSCHSGSGAAEWQAGHVPQCPAASKGEGGETCSTWTRRRRRSRGTSHERLCYDIYLIR